ncbi:MAG: bifunctional 5,10-methylenetetrahydrofolate dehydrogenase/5,10-methenyltetrahydrofolate cyclohydrolase [Chloroflexota bacterium]
MTTRTEARLLEGGPIAEEIRARVAADVAAFTRSQGHAPGLAVVVCGRSAPSMVYLDRILKACIEAGIVGQLVDVPGDDAETQAAGLADAVRSLSADDQVAGIIVQMPLPPGIGIRTVIDAIDPAKDIDGIHPLNAGLLRLGFEGFVPATAHAALEVLQRSGAPIVGAEAVVIGRSPVVGMPVAFMLAKTGATVTVCHSKTRDLAAHTRRADIIVVAAGHPGLLTGDMVKPGAVIIDVGINVVNGHLVGDVDFASVREVAGAITPVPGGVGPLTNALLLAHLVRAAQRQADERPDPAVRGVS